MRGKTCVDDKCWVRVRKGETCAGDKFCVTIRKGEDMCR